MPIKADRKYDGVIESGSYFSYSAKGTLAFNISISCEDGKTSYPLWLTEKTKEKALQILEMLGADISMLSNQNYLDDQLTNIITGKEISFDTKEHKYNGETTVKISWIGKRTDPNIARGAANFFGGKQQAAIDDSDIPF